MWSIVVAVFIVTLIGLFIAGIKRSVIKRPTDSTTSTTSGQTNGQTSTTSGETDTASGQASSTSRQTN